MKYENHKHQRRVQKPREPIIRDIEHGVEWKRRDPESERSYMDWLYERMKAIRETNIQRVHDTYELLTEDGYTHEKAVSRISEKFEIRPDEIEQMLAEEPGEKNG